MIAKRKPSRMGPNTESGPTSGPGTGAVILCGGYGTRMKSFTGGRIHKSEIAFDGKPLIWYTIEMLDPHIVDILSFGVGHHAKRMRRLITEYANAGELPHSGVKILNHEYGIASKIIEAIRTINAGGSDNIRDIVICNGDEIRHGFSLRDMHANHVSSGAIATFAVTDPENTIGNSMVFELGKDNAILKGVKRQDLADRELGSGGWQQHIGVLIMKVSAAELLLPEHRDWDRGVNLPLVASGGAQAHRSPGIIYANVNSENELDELMQRLLRDRRAGAGI
jgi:NDP-sugar pyrophosphorylase family protein